MKTLWTILFLLFTGLINAQQSVQVKLQVNEDLSILTDVSATPDSIPNGRYFVVYKNKTIIKGRTKNGKMDGMWVVYFPNGQQKMKARYVNGKPHGEWVIWGLQGDVQSKIRFNNGTPIGHWQGYYYNHSKAIDLIYNPDGTPSQCVQYYADDIIALNHEFEYDNKTKTETRSYYFKNYNLFHYEILKNNKLDGLYAVYHDNGIVWESFKYQNGRLNTIIENHSRGGMPRKNDQFRDGNGVLNKYYDTGNLFSKTRYKNGLKNDTIFTYNTIGKQIDQGFYTNGKPTGKWNHITFRSITDSAYIWNSTSPAPKEREEGLLFKGYRHGVWKSYNNYGEILTSRTYQFGFLDGVSKDYQTDKVIGEFHFSNGNRNGSFTFFSTYGGINSQEEYISKSDINPKWFEANQEDWITIENDKSGSNQVYLWFYPPLPGMELRETFKDPQLRNEMIFSEKRKFGYSYWPELIPASMPGGLTAEKEYIKKHLWVPKTLPEQKIKGSVLIRYKVDEIGLVSEVIILKSIGFGLDEAATSIIKSMPPLNSATYNGIPIPSYVVREIDFDL